MLIGEGRVSNLQQSQLWDWFITNLKEVADRWVFTVRWGQREGGQGDDGGEVTLGADGGEAVDPSQMPQDADQEEDHLPSNLRHLWDDDDDTDQVVLKWAHNYDDIHNAHYAWNWGAHGREPPWGSCTDLSMEQKTRMLKAVYNFDPKNTVHSLDAQAYCPPFLYTPWCDALCTQPTDFVP